MCAPVILEQAHTVVCCTVLQAFLNRPTQHISSAPEKEAEISGEGKVYVFVCTCVCVNACAIGM